MLRPKAPGGLAIRSRSGSPTALGSLMTRAIYMGAARASAARARASASRSFVTRCQLVEVSRPLPRGTTRPQGSGRSCARPGTPPQQLGSSPPLPAFVLALMPPSALPPRTVAGDRPGRALGLVRRLQLLRRRAYQRVRHHVRDGRQRGGLRGHVLLTSRLQGLRLQRERPRDGRGAVLHRARLARRGRLREEQRHLPQLREE